MAKELETVKTLEELVAEGHDEDDLVVLRHQKSNTQLIFRFPDYLEIKCYNAEKKSDDFSATQNLVVACCVSHPKKEILSLIKKNFAIVNLANFELNKKLLSQIEVEKKD